MTSLKSITAIAAISALCACSSPTAQRIVRDGDLFCSKVVAGQPLVVALANAVGVPVNVINKSSAVVADACAVIGAIPVVPPPVPAAAPVVAAPVAPAASAKTS